MYLTNQKETMHLLHKNLDNFLTEIDSPFSIDEVSGYLSGFASSNVPYEKYHNGLTIYFSTNGVSMHGDLNLDIIKSNISHISASLEKHDFSFPFDSSKDLTKKLINLAAWSKNFILSINYLMDNKLLNNTLNIQEIMHDLTEISKVEDKYNLDNSTDNNNYYDDISDYVISSMYYIYMESKKLNK